MANKIERLDKIVNRVIELEWEWDAFWSAACSLSFMDSTPPVETVYTVAERLLAAFEPGVAVEIVHSALPIYCAYGCSFSPHHCNMANWNNEVGEWEHSVDCPGPGKYKLVKVNDG